MHYLLDLLIPAAHAHERWFVMADAAASYVRPEWYLQANAATAAVVLSVIAVLTIGIRLDRAYERSDAYARFDRIASWFRAYAPRALSFCLGASLLWSAWQGTLIADDLALPAALVGTVFRAAEFAVGSLLVLGVFSAEAGLLVAALYGALFAFVPWTRPLDYLYIPAAGLFVCAFSPDSALGRAVRTSPVSGDLERKRAYLLLRICLGSSLLVLASAKLLDPGLHFGLMDAYPDLNPYTILASLGVSLSRETYVFALFVGELLTGLAVLSGIFQRALGLLLIPLFTVSVAYLGPLELVGHLPIIGTLFVFFAFGDRYRPGGSSRKYEKRLPA